MSKITKTPIKVKEHFSTHALQASNYTIRTETYEGKPHLVVPVIMMAEWATAGDDRVCDECASLEGKIFTLEEIESMIPRHPQCRCIALPIEKKDTIMHKEEQTD